MSGLHTIFDTRRSGPNHYEGCYLASDVKLKTILLARYYSLSFLAERGELTTLDVTRSPPITGVRRIEFQKLSF
jgi:hypothetical protein